MPKKAAAQPYTELLHRPALTVWKCQARLCCNPQKPDRKPAVLALTGPLRVLMPLLFHVPMMPDAVLIKFSWHLMTIK